MSKIEGNCRDVCEATEFVTIVTTGDDGPHVVGNWGDYMRALGIGADTLVFPAGHYRQTEMNLRKNNRIQVLVASGRVQGTRSPGQGYLIDGTAEIVTSGETADAAKVKFPWAQADNPALVAATAAPPHVVGSSPYGQALLRVARTPM